MYRKKLAKAIKPRLRNVIVPRLNLAALHQEVEQASTKLNSQRDTSCSTEAVTSSQSRSLSRSGADEPSSSRALREDYHVNHESLKDNDEEKQQQKEEPEREGLHYPHVFRNEFYEHADNAAPKLLATKEIPKADSGFNYPHIFRKEFYEHADHVTESSKSSAKHPSQGESLSAQEKGFTIATEEQQEFSPSKRCQVHDNPVRKGSLLQEKSSSPLQRMCSTPKLKENREVAFRREDEKAPVDGGGKVKFPCFGQGYSSWPPSPHNAAIAAETRIRHAAPQSPKSSPAAPQYPDTTILEKKSGTLSPKNIIVSPCPHDGSVLDGFLKRQDQPLRHRSYFNDALERGQQREQLRSPPFDLNPVTGDHREETNVRFHKTPSCASGSSSGTSIGDVHHECICSKGSGTPTGSDLAYMSCKPQDRKDYDPFSHMWDREVPQPTQIEPPLFEKHLPCSIVGKCNKEAYNKYYLEGRKKDGSRPSQMEVPCPSKEAVTISELDEQMRTLFQNTSEHLPPESPEWPTVARARGSQFSTAIGDARQDKHYVSSGKFDVLPVPTHLGSTIPPLRVKGEAARKLRCPTCGADVCKDCSSTQERWPSGSETAKVAELLGKILEKESEQFKPREALRKLAEKRGITVDKLVDSKRTSERSTRSGKSHPRFHDLCEIQDPCCPRLVPRKVGKQVDEKWLALKRMRPSMSDLWVQEERCPQVCAPAPMSCRPRPAPPVPWDTAKEKSMVWEQRVSSCRAAFCTMAVYDSYRV